jgi:hypothetical protein
MWNSCAGNISECRQSLQLVCMIVCYCLMQDWPAHCSAVSNSSRPLGISVTIFNSFSRTCDIFKGWGWCWQIWNMKEMDFWLFLYVVAVNTVLWFNVLIVSGRQKDSDMFWCECRSQSWSSFYKNVNLLLQNYTANSFFLNKYIF